ncbi:hypothetical protein [Vulcanisaeta souniana]|nr:hypothetical protein [Vulcanisaeta souniana]
MGYDFDVIILDSPNWVYQFFEMTFPLAPLYVAITRPGLQEINKFVDFLRRIMNMLYNQKIFIPRNKNYESLISYVVNQYRSNMRTQEIMKAWHEVNEIMSKEFPNVRPLVTNDMPDKYYGDEDTEFVGFRYLDEISLDSYVESGPLYVRKRTSKSTKPIKQFEAYYKLLKQFVSEMTPVEVDH